MGRDPLGPIGRVGRPAGDIILSVSLDFWALLVWAAWWCAIPSFWWTTLASA
jgi:hypothetical protein